MSQVILKVGDAAPDFQLPGSDGQVHRLSESRGRWVIVYFYPRDNTPGCTQEACDLRDQMEVLARRNVLVWGVSKDSVASHQKFIADHALNFVLLSDSDLVVHGQYGAFGEKKQYGQIRQGVIRSTFLMDPKGQIARAWFGVRVKGHVGQVMKALGEGGGGV